MSNSAIPTIGINGIQFRSRIEAQWAEMFTKLGWDWEYEPFDLKGYIPDFIIKFPYKHVLVEVKGDTNMENIEQYAEKIIKSGWDGEFILVCSVLGEDKDNNNSIYIGLLGSSCVSHLWCEVDFDEDGNPISQPLYPTVKNNDYAMLTTCDDCEQYTINHEFYGWNCRNCGSGYSNKSLIRNVIKKYEYIGHSCNRSFFDFDSKCNCITRKKNPEYTKINKYWIDAKNNVQWKSPRLK